MTGQRPIGFRYCKAVLAGGLIALALPTAVTLLADAPSAAKLAPTTSTSKPAVATPKSKEAKKADKAEEIARVMDFFKVAQPDVYDKAVKLRETDPAKFEAIVQPAIHTVNSLEELRKTDPDFYKLKIEDYQLTFQFKSKAEELRRPDIVAGERDKVLADMNAIAVQQFDVEQQIRQKEIAAIEERVKKLQTQLEDREKTKDQIIKRRLDGYGKNSTTTTAP